MEVAGGHAGVPPEQCWLWPLPEEPTLSPAARPWAAEPPSCTCSALVNIASPSLMQSRKDCNAESSYRCTKPEVYPPVMISRQGCRFTTALWGIDWQGRSHSRGLLALESVLIW